MNNYYNSINCEIIDKNTINTCIKNTDNVFIYEIIFKFLY